MDFLFFESSLILKQACKELTIYSTHIKASIIIRYLILHIEILFPFEKTDPYKISRRLGIPYEKTDPLKKSERYNP